jgi:hypothetical protein
MRSRLENTTRTEALTRRLVAEVLTEIRGSFNWSKFRQLNSLYDMHSYAEQHLQSLGMGSARAVFALSSGKVLKIAHTGGKSMARGLAQNEAEADLSTDPKSGRLFAPVLDFDSKYRWIVAEIAREISEDELVRLTGVPIGLLGWVVDAISNGWPLDEGVRQWLVREGERFQFGGFSDDLTTVFTKAGVTEDMIDILEDIDHPENEVVEQWVGERVVRFFWKNEFLRGIEKMMRQGVAGGDIPSLNHWGVDSRGNVVMLDYGYTTSVQDEFY